MHYTGGGGVGEVLEATGGRGVDVALECVGGGVGARAYECLAPLGRLVTYGAAGGEGLRPPDMWQLNLKGQTVGGYGGPGSALAPLPGPGKPSRVFSGTAA